MSGSHDALIAELETRLGVSVLALSPLSGGACQENYRVDLEKESGGALGARTAVLRCDAASSLPFSIDRAQEHAVIGLAVQREVRTPAARELLSDLPRAGAHAYLMDWVDGVAIGRKVVKEPALAQARQRLPDQLAQELSKIHSIGPGDFENPLASGYNPDPSCEPSAAALRSLRTMMDAMKEPHPAMELAYAWLSQRAPADEEVVLTHGDFRTGNFMIDEAGLVAVLDWEFAHWGSPAEDLSWICLRDWRFGVLDKEAGGFAERESFFSAYESASRRRVDRDAVRWWEILNNLAWAGGCVYQGERYLSGEESDIELVAIGRRAAEMEWEALRLIERAGGVL